MMKKLNNRVVHIVKSGDIFSKLISYYYGKTEGYKLVNVVGRYNSKDIKHIIPGDILYFPQVPIGKKIYSSKKEHKDHRKFINNLIKKAKGDNNKKKYDGAIKKLEKVVSIQPDNFEALKHVIS